MSNIPWSKEQLFKANEKLRKQNQRYKQALEEIAYKQHNVEPKRAIVKLQAKARQALGGNDNE